MYDAVGFHNRHNLLAWLFAGGLAYYWWIRPEQLAAAERKAAQQRSKQYYESHGMPEYDYKKESVSGSWMDSWRTWLEAKTNSSAVTANDQPPQTAVTTSSDTEAKSKF